MCTSTYLVKILNHTANRTIINYHSFSWINSNLKLYHNHLDEEFAVKNNITFNFSYIEIEVDSQSLSRALFELPW